MKRYGRNQKRAHRERIATLEDQVQALILWERAKAEERRKLEAALAAQRREFNALVEEIREVARNSALLPAEEVDLRGEGPWRLVIPLQIRHFAFNESLVQPMMISTVDIYEVRACLEENRATFEKIVHVELPNRSFGYAISREAMAAYGRHQLHRVAEHIFSSIMAALRRV